MLPAIPGTFGRLSDVFVSSLGAITGADNRLGFARAKRVVVVLVDGLGATNLKAAGGHAPFLQQALSRSKPIACGFPSTTATSLSSFGTGVSAGQHGMVGYKVYDRTTRRSFNLLNGWDAQVQSSDWQTMPTVSQRAIESGVASYFIGPKAYEGSDFTQAIMRDSTYRAGKSVADRFAIAAELIGSGRPDSLTYLYVPELDQIAHAQGVASDRWLIELEELNSQVEQLAGQMGKDDALLLTADHGVLDIPTRNHVYLDELPVDWSPAIDVSGEPRVNFVYLQDGADASAFAASLQESLAGSGLALTRAMALEAKLYGTTNPGTISRLPDVFVLATKNVAYYHRDYAPAASLNMIGQHGGLSNTELAIPLLGWGAFGAR
jgi:predicted AlkP superfamily pyrophosphatase or phosphodiesterase